MLGNVTRLEMKDELRLALEFVEVSPVSSKKLHAFMDKANDSA